MGLALLSALVGVLVSELVFPLGSIWFRIATLQESASLRCVKCALRKTISKRVGVKAFFYLLGFAFMALGAALSEIFTILGAFVIVIPAIINHRAVVPAYSNCIQGHRTA